MVSYLFFCRFFVGFDNKTWFQGQVFNSVNRQVSTNYSSKTCSTTSEPLKCSVTYLHTLGCLRGRNTLDGLHIRNFCDRIIPKLFSWILPDGNTVVVQDFFPSTVCWNLIFLWSQMPIRVIQNSSINPPPLLAALQRVRFYVIAVRV